MTAHRPLTATNLRLILSSSLFVIAIAASIVFYMINDGLHAVAIETNHTVVDSNASQNNLETLKKIQKELITEKDVVDRAGSIVAESKSYQYQDQVLTDLKDYASQAGITITNLDFSATAGAPSSTPATGTAPATAPSTSTINGVKSTSVSVTLKNPVPYDNLLRFIKSIEQNLTKMQISKIGIAKDTAGGVSSQVLTVEVYIR